jgi:transposase
MATRKRYPLEFKREAVRHLENRGDRSVSEVGRELGVKPNQLHKWRLELGRTGKVAPTTAEQAEIRRLQKRVRDLEEDREILKKAAAFFAKEHG